MQRQKQQAENYFYVGIWAKIIGQLFVWDPVIFLE